LRIYSKRYYLIFSYIYHKQLSTLGTRIPRKQIPVLPLAPVYFKIIIMTTITQRILNLFEKHPQFFIGDISHRHPLTVQQLEQFEEKLYWKSIEPYHTFGGLSWNGELKWSKELMDQFSHRWDWNFISCSVIGEFIWFDGILDYFDDRLDWIGISGNWDIPWNTQLIEQYADKVDWEWFSRNQNVPWTEELIHKYADKIDFQMLSYSSNSPLCQTNYKITPNTLLIPEVSHNINLIELYEDRWDWDCLHWNWLNGLSQAEQNDLVETMLRNAPVAPESVEEPFSSEN